MNRTDREEKFLPECRGWAPGPPGRRPWSLWWELAPVRSSGWYRRTLGPVARRSTAWTSPSRTWSPSRCLCKLGCWREEVFIDFITMIQYVEVDFLQSKLLASYLWMLFLCCLNVTIVLSPWAEVLTWLRSGDRVMFSKRLNWRTETEETNLKT